LRGYPADFSVAGYRHSAALADGRSVAILPATGVLVGFAQAVSAEQKDLGVLDRRSAIAVAMVVLNRMLPQSENGVFVVMIDDLFWLCRVEITW
jgi:hypothetical protein